MSKRTDVFRSAVEAANLGIDLSGWFEEHATKDVVFYTPAVGGETRGRQAVIDAFERFSAQAKPRYRIDGDLVEHGNFVVGFMTVESGGATANVCQVLRFEGDRVSGEWGIRGQPTRPRGPRPSPALGGGGRVVISAIVRACASGSWHRRSHSQVEPLGDPHLGGVDLAPQLLEARRRRGKRSCTTASLIKSVRRPAFHPMVDPSHAANRQVARRARRDDAEDPGEVTSSADPTARRALLFTGVPAYTITAVDVSGVSRVDLRLQNRHATGADCGCMGRGALPPQRPSIRRGFVPRGFLRQGLRCPSFGSDPKPPQPPRRWWRSSDGSRTVGYPELIESSLALNHPDEPSHDREEDPESCYRAHGSRPCFAEVEIPDFGWQQKNVDDANKDRQKEPSDATDALARVVLHLLETGVVPVQTIYAKGDDCQNCNHPGAPRLTQCSGRLHCWKLLDHIPGCRLSGWWRQRGLLRWIPLAVSCKPPALTLRYVAHGEAIPF